MTSKAIFPWLSLCLSVALCCPGQESDGRQPPSASVVSVGILVLQASGAEQQAMGGSVNGSGFVVSREGYVITALHVVRATQRVQQELRGTDNRLYVGVRDGSSFSPLPAEMVDSDAAHDLALLRVRRLTRVSPVRCSSTQLADGELVEAAGLPAMAGAALVTNTGHFAESSRIKLGRRVVKGMSDAEASQLAPLSDFYFADMKTDEGMSGGPVYSVDSGAVIGVVHGYTQDPPLAVLIPARFVMDLLKRNGVSYQVTGGAQR